VKNVLDKNYRENQNTNFIFNKFFLEIVLVIRWYEKKRKMCCFISTSTMVMQKCHYVTLCVHCLSFSGVFRGI